MALQVTEDKFTADELVAVLEKTPALATEVKTSLERLKYFVADEATKQTYDTNIQTQAKSALTSEHAQHIEKEVFEITGVKKNDGEKYYDYMQRVLKDKTANEKLIASELTTLKSKSDISAAEREQLETQKRVIGEKDTQIQTLTNSHQSEINQLKAENKIYGEIGKIDAKLKKDIDPELLGMKRSQVIEEMKKSAKFQDGKLVYFGEDGKALTNATDASFMTSEQVYALKMDKFIDKGKTATGAGGSGEGNEEVVSGQFKTKQEVDTFLSGKGILQGTKEFSDEQKKYGYKTLPLQ